MKIVHLQHLLGAEYGAACSSRGTNWNVTTDRKEVTCDRCRGSFQFGKRPDAAPPTHDDILQWLSAEAGHWDNLRHLTKDVLGRDAAYRMYQTNLIWQRLTKWRDTGEEPPHGLE